MSEVVSFAIIAAALGLVNISTIITILILKFKEHKNG